jgi:hypothetical protein
MRIPRDGGGPASQGPLSRVGGLVEQAFRRPEEQVDGFAAGRERAPPGV